MNNAIQKIRLVYLPFLLIAVGFIVLYSAFNYFICQRWQWLNPKSDLLEYWLPLALLWIPVTIWLRPRLKLVRIRENSLFGIQFLAVALILVPTIIVQIFISSTSGHLISVNTPNEIRKNLSSKFFKPHKYYIDKVHVGYHAVLSVSGKRNDNLDYYLYVTLPIFENVADTTGPNCTNWLVTEYKEQFNNDYTSVEEDSIYQQFIERCQNAFDTTKFDKFVFIERINSNVNEYGYFKNAVKETNFVAYDELQFFKAHQEPFAERGGKKLKWAIILFFVCQTIFAIVVLVQKLHIASVRKFRKGIKPDNKDLGDFYSFFIPNKELFVAPLVIDICGIVFLLMVASGLGFVDIPAPALISWGGNVGDLTIGKNQWWRLVTNIFLHGGVMHLFANMVTFLFAGPVVEALLGKARTIFAYLIAGICASIVSVWWHPEAVSIGASGAIFGIYGLFLALLILKVLPTEFSKQFLGATIFFIVFNLFYGISGGIDNAAHIGGLISGFIIGVVLSGYVRRKIRDEITELEQTQNESENG